MNIEYILKDLSEHHIIDGVDIQFKKLNGGTNSQVYLLHGSEEYVVKINEANIIGSESFFLEHYRHLSLLPEPIYIDPLNRFLVYSFISGSVFHVKKEDLLTQLITDFINYYNHLSEYKGWGWLDEPVETWEEFLLQRVDGAREILASTLGEEDIEMVVDILQQPDRYEALDVPYIIHGDCGVHNFICSNGKFTGVIDPTPILGDPLYDLIYAFCSSPENLTIETIHSAASNLAIGKRSEPFLHEEVLIGLFLRLATCVKHHPVDLEKYLLAWKYWKDVVKT
ncbi:phosphotransferase family protein [Pseudalkalibacillus berkeleyi]|uniref:Aminoglycoside phosphotransferase family protein n=1 Tax=Pseudalkalibacillus berkeleyi TaxID=1069813 RepID=A0ABS9H2E8_9BACL|nr:aminoglycoside phosphotransferase family protein [Pseudalkalibacillus berkeleyi]MCF6138286.1 aminoglycoside phosphotransferase family protein [Pseudalkalibacillus berkeleyi]